MIATIFETFNSNIFNMRFSLKRNVWLGTHLFQLHFLGFYGGKRVKLIIYMALFSSRSVGNESLVSIDSSFSYHR